eukprot:CFRG4226T1
MTFVSSLNKKTGWEITLDQPGCRKVGDWNDRNKASIYNILSEYIQVPVTEGEDFKILEISSGTGQHAEFLSQKFPFSVWYPTDYDPVCIASTAAWTKDIPNVAEPTLLDASWPLDNWPAKGTFDVVYNCNTIHISPPAVLKGLIPDMNSTAEVPQARAYKNKGKDADHLRERRRESNIALRKNKRAEIFQKRRNVSNLALIEDEAQSEPVSTLSLNELVTKLMSDDLKLQSQGAQGIRKVLSRAENPPIKDVLQYTDVVPRMIYLLTEQYDAHTTIQLEAAWALTNIASGDRSQTLAVVSAGAVPMFVRLLASPAEDVAEQAVWALGNIAGDCSQYRDFVLQCGALRPLLALITETDKVGVTRNATWALSNLCRGKDPRPNFEIIQQAIPTLARLLYGDDEEVLADATWALSYICDGGDDKILAVIESGAVRRLVELLMHTAVSVKTPALRCIGNIVTGSEDPTQVVINCGALPMLVNLLDHQKESIRKETCWTISNITAGTQSQIQSIIDNNVIPPLLKTLTESSEQRTRDEACWALANLCMGGNDEQRRYLVERGFLKPFCENLNTAAQLTKVMLESIKAICETGDMEARATNGVNRYAHYIEEVEGVDMLERLQEHENNDVYLLAHDIITRYFVDDEDIDENIAPAVGANGFQFGVNSEQDQAGFNF